MMNDKGRKIKKRGIVFLCCAFLLLSLLNVTADAREQVSVRDMAIINSGHELLLYFRVSEPFTREMEEGIKNGIPVTFSFYIALHQQRSGWFDKEITSHHFERSLEYDSLKDEYKIRMTGPEDQIVTRTSLEEAKDMMKEVNDFAVIDLAKLVPGGNYSIRAKVSLEKKTLPFNFQNIIPFWNLWEFETELTEFNFIIPASDRERQRKSGSGKPVDR
ncbi:MAG: DUF4390 domain-containing protein [Desulfurivibrionaceae bacterium]